MRWVTIAAVVACAFLMLGCAMHPSTQHNLEQAIVNQAVEMVIKSL